MSKIKSNKAAKQETGVNPIYAFFYIIVKCNQKYFDLLEKIFIPLFHLLPEKWQTPLMKDAEARKKINKNTHDWSLGVVDAQSAMVAIFLAHFAPFVFIGDYYINKDNQNYLFCCLLIIIGLLSYFLTVTLFEESKYRKHFRQFEKKSRSWKYLWLLITISYIVALIIIAGYLTFVVIPHR